MAHIQYLTQVHLDPGVVKRLIEECQRIGIRKPLVISDPGVRAAGVLDRVLAALGEMPHAVFDATPSNPTEAAVRTGVATYRGSEHAIQHAGRTHAGVADHQRFADADPLAFLDQALDDAGIEMDLGQVLDVGHGRCAA